MVEVVWTAQSLNDIDQIAEYIAKDSFNYAKGVVERIFSLEKYLKKDSEFGRIVPEFNDKKIREVITGNYRVVYRVYSVSQIQILAVHHGARKLTKRIVK
ncbi:MAG: type II toxin-antitoxin system RelE/ParE family toxin [Bacteroidia bacterium]